MSYLLNIEKEKLLKLKEIALRERTSMKNIINNQIDEYIKIHGDGNPNYEITNFFEADFNICPAVFRDGNAWKNYLAKRTPKELEEIKQQVIMIDKKLSQYL